MIAKDEASNMTYSASPTNYYPIIPYLDNWILVESSSDTVYKVFVQSYDDTIYCTNPSVQSMDPEVFLFAGILTDCYYFMKTVKKVYDFGTNSGFPGADLMYDKQEKAIFRYTLYNDDHSNKKQDLMTWGPWMPVNDEIAIWQPLQAHKLVNAYEKGELKGRLKENRCNLGRRIQSGDNVDKA